MATRTVYRYRSLRGDGLGWQWELITHGLLYFPKPSELNDPFECRPPRLRLTEDGVRTQLRRMHARFDVREEDLDSAVSATMAERDTMSRDVWAEILAGAGVDAGEVGVVSFAEEPGSVQMWSLYADSHRGICLRFELPEALENEGSLFKVQYSDDMAVWDVGGDLEEFTRATFMTKATRWQDEREWRLIDPDRESKKTLKPYPIAGVILGARIEAGHAEIIKGWVRDSGQPIEVLRAGVSADRYEIELRPAEPTATPPGRRDC